MKFNVKTGIAAALLLSTAVGNAQTNDVKQEKPGINLSYMDRKVKPGDDFFRFVNGTWVDQTEIPGDKTRWGSFDELRERTNNDALAILKEAAANKSLKSNTDQGKAASLYRTIMDTVARNKAGITPLKPYLKKIDAVKDIKSLQALLIEMET
jgi:putative endopeptidase